MFEQITHKKTNTLSKKEVKIFLSALLNIHSKIQRHIYITQSRNLNIIIIIQNKYTIFTYNQLLCKNFSKIQMQNQKLSFILLAIGKQYFQFQKILVYQNFAKKQKENQTIIKLRSFQQVNIQFFVLNQFQILQRSLIRIINKKILQCQVLYQLLISKQIIIFEFQFRFLLKDYHLFQQQLIGKQHVLLQQIIRAKQQKKFKLVSFQQVIFMFLINLQRQKLIEDLQFKLETKNQSDIKFYISHQIARKQLIFFLKYI
eukprot:TRINITY_DN2145_c0_g1_i10.p1 TRINITY_DN2145_c0_g1~~TRINITY_DN2145_c0_g1_i10.p1  ORF type:complete len:258 (-),score=-22.81 TRINITY_DN2145_c0_g1_i10:551-1324(-)